MPIMFYIRPDPRKWYIPYGKVVCGKCARNKPTEMMEYTPPISCGICGRQKTDSQFLVYMIAEKPQIERKMPIMQNIMFTPPADQKILDGTKTMTARNWKRKPPKSGDMLTASTGYPKSTRFAIIRVLNVWEWNALMGVDSDAETVTGMSKQEIAEREGFGNTPRPEGSWLTDWDAFIEAYYSINAKKFLDDDRLNYFIAFEVVR